MAKIEFKADKVSAAVEHTIQNFYLEETLGNKSAKKIKLVDSLDLEVTLKDGESITVNKEDLATLVKTGRIRSKEDVEKREKLKRAKTPLYQRTPQDKKLLLMNISYEA